LTPLCTPFILAQRSASQNPNIKRAPGRPYVVYHPNVQEPEQVLKLKGSLEGPARYIPNNYRHQLYIDAIRSGEYKGKDWPYNFLSGQHWMTRRYNVTYNELPVDVSELTGITYFSRYNVWATEWHETGKQKIKWFRAQYGFLKAKYAAEDFRRKLIAAGRVDNRRTERQIRLQHMAGADARKLKKKKFARKDYRRLGNSGTRLGNERRVREDYRRRGLLQ